MELSGIVADEGMSAKDLRRPGMAEILFKARERSVEAVIVVKLDRMFRSTVDALETTRQLDKWASLSIAFKRV